MSEALRNHLMLVVDQTARIQRTAGKSWNHVKDDATGARFCGVLISQLMFKTGWSGDRLRYHLRALVAAGSLVEYQIHAGAPRMYWPAGLYQKLKKEQSQ